jgi:hypothetical protein
VEIIKIIIGCIFGYFFTGYLVSLLCKTNCKVVSSYLISLLILFYSIFIPGIFGIFLDYDSVLMSLGVVTVILLLVVKYRQDGNVIIFLSRKSFNLRYKVLLVFPFFVCLELFLRGYLRPLISPDAVFRWNFLPRLMIAFGRFSFYPPYTAEDYKFYYFSEGIPPLIQFTYFWLYTSFSAVDKHLTAFITLIQYSFTIFLVFKSSERIFSSQRAAWISSLVFISSSLTFFSFYLGQETGMTALSTAAVLFYAVEFRYHKSKISAIIPLAVAASLGGLSREYGIIIIFCGILFLYMRKTPYRYILFFTVLSIIFTAPWYIRSWIITGNPFYCNIIASIFPVNSVHAGIFKVYSEKLGLILNYQHYLHIFFRTLLIYAPLYIILTVIIIFSKIKYKNYFIFASVVISVLWVYSITQTNGGIFYSMRVLSTVGVLISVMSGGVYKRLYKKKFNFKLQATFVCFFIIWGMYINFTSHYLPWKIPVKDWWSAGFTPAEDNRKLIHKYFSVINKHSRVLSDCAFYHAELVLNNKKGIDMVAVWSPEVRYLFSQQCSFEKGVAFLKKHNIKYVLYFKELNRFYLEKFPFFAEYRKKSKLLAAGSDAELYQLPVVDILQEIKSAE